MANEEETNLQFLAKLAERFPSVWNGTIVLQGRVATLKLHFMHGDKEAAVAALRQQEVIKSDTIEPIASKTTAEYFEMCTECDVKNACVLLAMPYGATEEEVKISTDKAQLFLDFIHSQNPDEMEVSDSSGDIADAPSVITEKQSTENLDEETKEGRKQNPYSVYLYIPNSFTEDLIKKFAPDWCHELRERLYFIAVVAEKKSGATDAEESEEDDAYDEETEEYDEMDEENMDPNLRNF